MLLVVITQVLLSGEMMYPIEQVILHRSPMRLIDELLEFNEISAKVAVTIGPKSEFFSKSINGVPSYVGIEYMAQCIAAFAGANAVSKEGSVSLGFLLGTRKYKPKVKVFKLDQMLIVKAEELMCDSSGLSVFECKIIDGISKEILASANVNVFQPDDVNSYFQEQK